uniref:Uncharacterized protein n=1 Tax=Cucumis melo TaxID=3656 RepID=A0A9I9EE39_CUCME
MSEIRLLHFVDEKYEPPFCDVKSSSTFLSSVSFSPKSDARVCLLVPKVMLVFVEGGPSTTLPQKMFPFLDLWDVPIHEDTLLRGTIV